MENGMNCEFSIKPKFKQNTNNNKTNPFCIIEMANKKFALEMAQ